MQRSKADRHKLHTTQPIVLTGVVAMLLSAAVLLSVPVQAVQQFSQTECQTLNKERRTVRKQLRQPYKAAQGKALQQREQQLQKLLTQHCRKPVPDVPAAPVKDKTSDGGLAGRDGKAGQANQLL